MAAASLNVKVFRFDPSKDKEPHYDTYQVPWVKGMSAMDALDYIYQNVDGTLAYYDHAGCSLGICARCTGKVNGKASLLCQTAVENEAVIEPSNPSKVLRDLVPARAER